MSFGFWQRAVIQVFSPQKGTVVPSAEAAGATLTVSASNSDTFLLYADPDATPLSFFMYTSAGLPVTLNGDTLLVGNSGDDPVSFGFGLADDGNSLLAIGNSFSTSFVSLETVDGQPVLAVNGAGTNIEIGVTTVVFGVDSFGEAGATEGMDFSFVMFLGDDLANLDFTGSDMTAAQFAGANLSNSKLASVNLTNANFAAAHANAAATCVGVDLTSADLTGVNLAGADFSNAVFSEADLSGANLVGTNFSGADLSAVVFSTAPIFSTDPTNRTNFSGATVPVALIGTKWSVLDLSRATIVGLGSSVSNLTASNTLFQGSDFSGIALQSADFESSDFTGANLTAADLTSANLTGALLFSATLSGATMVGTNCTGAQLGAKQTLFTVGTDIVSALNAGEIPTSLVQAFAQNNITLTSAARLVPRIAGQDWLIEDLNDTYDIVNTGTVLAVMDFLGGSTAAVLTEAYMPNAVFTNANLFAVNASQAQWYGTNASADNADLEEADLTSANLGSMNLAQAKLFGATLDQAILVNANLSGAFLTPSASGRAASLVSASLQGTNFTEAALGAAVLTDAAVALDAGVPLFTLAETFVSELDLGTVGSDLQTAFANAGYPLQSDVSATVVQSGTQWSLANGMPAATNLSSLYASFNMMLTGSSIQVYGSSLWVTQLGTGNTLETTQIIFPATVLAPGNLNSNTVCPNGQTYADNVAANLSWEQMMTAKQPPTPPACVTSPNQWCPATFALPDQRR